MKRWLLLSVFALGCAEGGDPSKAEPVNDAQAEVPTIEVSTTDTTVEDTGSAIDSNVVDVVDSAVVDSAPADSGTVADSATDSVVVDVADTSGPWLHTIAIDGTNDFYVDHEKFTTTTTAFDAFVTWDATNVYFGMNGADIGTSSSATKWVFLYVDTDPGASTGSLNAAKYNTQQAKLPTGFGAEFYLRWKTDDTYVTIEKWEFATSAWSTLTTTVDHKRTGNYVEFRVPRTTFGAATTLGLVSFMINEQATLESTFAGLYSGNFTDGYATAKSITKYLSADMLSVATPNSPTRMKP